MFRTIIELIVTLIVAFAARAIFSSVMKSMGNASSGGFQQQRNAPGTQSRQSDVRGSGELHKDPVCGTYVSEATAFRRQASGKTFYYCSDACRLKHVGYV